MNAPAATAAAGDDRAPAIDEVLAQRPALAALAEQLYGHVLDCIDFGALFGLEQVLWCLVSDLGDEHLDEEGELSRGMIVRAIVRAASDPLTRCTDVPYGITREEAKAVRFDEACPFCRAEDELAEVAPSEHDPGDESCPCCDELAREWREQHADALVRRLQAANRRKGGRS